MSSSICSVFRTGSNALWSSPRSILVVVIVLANDKCVNARGTSRIRPRDGIEISEYEIWSVETDEVASVAAGYGSSISSRICTSIV